MSAPAKRQHVRTDNPKTAGRVPSWVYERQSAERSGVPKAGRYLRHCGKRPTPEFASYRSALRRCHDPRDKSFADYGGRGITVCDEWRGSDGFDLFMDHVGPRPEGTTIDRIDNSRGYEPGNVRWGSWVEQANNRRGNRLVTVDGVTRTAAEWALAVGLPRRQIVVGRLESGWHAAAAVFGLAGESKDEAHARLGLEPERATVLGPPKGRPLKTKDMAWRCPECGLGSEHRTRGVCRRCYNRAQYAKRMSTPEGREQQRGYYHSKAIPAEDRPGLANTRPQSASPPCPWCDASGFIPATSVLCRTCHGTGKQVAR